MTGREAIILISERRFQALQKGRTFLKKVYLSDELKPAFRRMLKESGYPENYVDRKGLEVMGLKVVWCLDIEINEIEVI